MAIAHHTDPSRMTAASPIDQFIRHQQERERLSDAVREHLAKIGLDDLTDGEDLLSPQVLRSISALLEIDLYTLLVAALGEALGTPQIRDREIFLEQFARWFLSTPPWEIAQMLHRSSEEYAALGEQSPARLSKADRSQLATAGRTA